MIQAPCRRLPRPTVQGCAPPGAPAGEQLPPGEEGGVPGAGEGEGLHSALLLPHHLHRGEVAAGGVTTGEEEHLPHHQGVGEEEEEQGGGE